MSLLSTRNLTYYHPETSNPSLSDINLEVNTGEFVLLMGASGSGKSTLLQILAGLIHTLGGRIRGQVIIEDSDVIRNPDAKRGVVGLVLPDPEPQLISLTVSGEIRFGPENLLLSREEVATRLAWALRRCRLQSVKDNYVYALSGGQKQRVVVAAGLSMKPRILLLDGPTTNLDPEGAREVMSVINELREAGSAEAVIVAANKVDHILPLATRIIVLDRGKVFLDGEPADVICQVDALQALGLFVPEVARIHDGLNQNRPTKTPLSVPDLVSELRPLGMRKPTINTNTHRIRPAVVYIDDVWFGYGVGQPVVRGISTVIRQGEFLAVVGQNGSGKTTLMSLIAGLKQPAKGRVLVNGVSTEAISAGTVAYVFQYPEHQFVERTVERELSFSLKRLGRPASEVSQRVNEVLDLFSLSHLKDSPPYFLSMGEKRLLSVATMLVTRPSILILDEPTTGLDAAMTRKLMSILQMLVHEHGMTLIQVSHDMEQVSECERVLAIDKGRIIFDGSPRELFVDHSVLQLAKLEPPPVAQLSQALWPDQPALPITVSEFLGGNTHANF